MTDKEVSDWKNFAMVGKNKEEYDVNQWDDIIVSDDEASMKLSNQVF